MALRIDSPFEAGYCNTAINAQPLEKVKLATLPDSYSSAQS